MEPFLYLFGSKGLHCPRIINKMKELFYSGDLPSAKDLRDLVNLDAVKNSIGEPVTNSQRFTLSSHDRQNERIVSKIVPSREAIRKDLDVAMKEFMKREQASHEASFTIPFVTVNNRTNIVAIHSRLLLALQSSVEQSVGKLEIPPDSGAFDEVS